MQLQLSSTGPIWNDVSCNAQQRCLCRREIVILEDENESNESNLPILIALGLCSVILIFSIILYTFKTIQLNQIKKKFNVDFLPVKRKAELHVFEALRDKVNSADPSL